MDMREWMSEGMSELEAFLSLIILPLPYLPLRSRAREMWVTKVIDGREKGWQTKRRGIAASPIHSALCTRYLTEEPLWRREEISNQGKELRNEAMRRVGWQLIFSTSPVPFSFQSHWRVWGDIGVARIPFLVIPSFPTRCLLSSERGKEKDDSFMANDKEKGSK